jgi:hypothetical protein
MVSSAVMTVFGGGCPASDCQTEVLVSDLSCHDMLCGVFTPGFRCYACVKCITRLNSVSMNRRHSVELENVREKTITRRTSEPTKDAKNARSPFFFTSRRRCLVLLAGIVVNDSISCEGAEGIATRRQ